jgi:hypothetical protein
MQWFPHVLVVTATLSSCSKSKPTPLPLEVTAKTIDAGGKIAVQLDIATQPGAWLYVDGATIGPTNQAADAQGHATFVVDPKLPEGGSVDLKVSAAPAGGNKVATTWWKQPGYKIGGIPLRLESEHDRTSVTCRDAKDRCSISWSPQQQLLDIRDIPAGAILEIDGKPITLKQNERTTVPLDATALIERFGPADACNGKSMSAPRAPAVMPVKLTTADHTVVTGELDFTRELCSLAAIALANVSRGPVLPAGGPGTVTAVDGSGGLRTLGPAKTLADVRLVVLAEEVERNESCGTYENETTGARQEITKAMFDLHAKAYERATGKVVAEKTFRARPGKCPQRMSEREAIATRAEPSDVERWAATL